MYKTVKLCIRLSILVGIILGCFFIPRGFAEDSKNDEKLARLTPQEIEQNEKDRQDAINAFVKQGMDYFKKGKYIEAKVQFEKALKLDATQPQSLDYLKKCDAEIANQKNPKKPTPVVTPEPKSQEKPIVTETKAQKEQEEKQKQEEKKAAEQKAKEEAAAKKQQQAEELAAQKKADQEKKAQEIAAKEAAKKAEEDKIAAEKAEKEKAKAEAEAKKQQQAEELAAQKKAKEEQIAAEKAAKQKEKEDAITAKKKADEEKIAQEKAAKETAPKTEDDRIAAEKAAKEKAKAEADAKKQQQAEELAAQKKADQEKKAQEIAAKEAAKKAEEDKIAAEKAEKEKAKEEASAKKQQQAEELAAQKKAKEEQIAAEKAAKQKEREDAIAAQKKAEEDRIAAEKGEKEKAKADADAKKQQQAEELAAQKKAADEKKAQEIAAKKSEEEQRIAAQNAAKEKAKEEAAAKKAEEEQRMAAKKAEEEQRVAAKKAEEEQRLAAKKAEEQKAQQEKLAQANVQQPPPAPAVTVDTKKQIRDGLNRGKQLYRSNKVADLTQSVQEFQQVLAIDPGNSEAVRYLNLAQTKLENRQQADAQKAAEEAAAKQAAPTPVVQAPTQSSVHATQPVQPVVTVDATQTSPQPSIDTVSSDEKARQEALKRADEEEKRVRAEREREDAAKKATEAEDHYKAGMTYLNQGLILKAHDEWETVLALVPNHQGAKAMIEETRTQYEAALEVQRKEQETARVEAENEKKMNDPIITIDVADQEIGDVLTQMGAVVGFNMVIGEGVKAKVSASFTNVSLKKALDTLLPINGFKYIRQGDIIQVSLDLRTKIYPLTDDQVKKLRFAMVEDKILQRELYGPDAKPKVPGQELTLDEQAHLLSITDSAVNIGKLDEFLQNLPPIRGEELITRVYTLRQGDAEEIRKLVQAVLSASPVKGIPDEERKVILEPGSNTLVIRDSVDNLKKVEEFLTDKHFLEKLTNQELVTKVYHLSSEENATTPDALARKAELVNNVGEVLETMLYAAEGREKAYEENRRIFKDPRYGTITVVDTQDNQRKIEDYVAQLPTGQEQKLLSKVFTIKNADPNNIRNLINQIIQESESTAGGGGTVGDYVTGTISAGAGNGLTFLDVTVELIQVTGDKTNPSARLYIYTPTRDREVTLTKGNSELVDEYRVRLIDANPQTQEAEIEIRLASFTAAQRANGNVTAPGYGQPQTGAATGAPGVPGAAGTNGTTPQQVHRRPTLRVDTDSNTIIVLAFDPNDMTLIEEWINKLDVPILQVSIEAKFVDVNETQAKEMGVDWLVPSLSNWGSFKPVQDQLSFGGTVSGNPDPISNSVSQDPLIANLRNDSLMSGGTLFEFQTVGGLQMTLDTLEAQGVINLISSPRVVAVNGEQANLTVTESIPYLFPAAVTYPATGIPQFNGIGWAFDSINISLNFTPTVHSDGSIILDFSSPSTGTGGISVDKLVGRVPEEALLGSQLLNYLSPQLQENTDYGQPIIDNRNIQTRVSVKDGETIVMGGLIEENDHTATTQVPLLGDIPVLGYLFKKSLDYKEKNRLFIFLTATIVQ